MKLTNGENYRWPYIFALKIRKGPVSLSSISLYFPMLYIAVKPKNRLINKIIWWPEDVLDFTSETTVCPDQFIFEHVINHSHSVNLNRLICTIVTQVGLPLEDASDVVNQRSEIRLTGRSHVVGNMIVKFIAQPRLGRVAGIYVHSAHNQSLHYSVKKSGRISFYPENLREEIAWYGG